MDNKNELINGIIDSSPVPAGPRTIMIVEDEVLLAFEIKETLEKNGYEVIATAVSGLEAIQKADQYRPDLILMDINLQGKMDGTEAAAVIRLRYNIPVIFLTAYSQRDLIEKAKLARPFSYLIKPVSEDYLIAAVSVAFYTHSMEKKLAESEERFRLFFDSYPDPIAILNREKKILLANSKFRRVLAALRGSNPQQQNNPAELPDKNINITDTLPWQAWELSFLDKILDAAYFDLPSKTIQINLCGSWYEVSASSTPWGCKEKAIRLVFHDITDRKKLQERTEELNEAVALLDSLIKEKTQKEVSKKRNYEPITAFIIYEDGRLIFDISKDPSKKDTDVLAGMIKVVEQFCRDAFGMTARDNLKRLKFGEINMLLEHGKVLTLAILHYGEENDFVRHLAKEAVLAIEKDYAKFLFPWDGNNTPFLKDKDTLHKIIFE